MQLGTRWRHGEEMPARLPAEYRKAIEQVDEPVSAWTLTWLEGKAVVESDTLADGSWLRFSTEGETLRFERKHD